MRFLTLPILALMLAGCQEPKPVAYPANPQRLQPDQAIVLERGAVACEQVDDVMRAAEHERRNEMNLWYRIAGNAPACVNGLDVKPGAQWTVLRVEGPLMLIAQTKIEQYTSDPRWHGRTYWAEARWGHNPTP